MTDFKKEMSKLDFSGKALLFINIILAGGLLMFVLGVFIVTVSSGLGIVFKQFGKSLFLLGCLADLILIPVRIKVAKGYNKLPRAPIVFWLLVIAGWIGGGIIAIFMGIFPLLYNCFNFLYKGDWKSQSAIEYLSEYKLFSAWAISPGNWVGLHKVLQFLNDSLFLIIFGIVLMLIVSLPFYFWDKKYDSNNWFYL